MGKLARLIIQPQDVLYDLLSIFQPKVGEYYPSIRLRQAAVTFYDLTANVLRAMYYPIFRKMRFDRVAFYVAGAGGTGARIRLGIYDDDNFKPKSLLDDFGEIDASSAGMKSIDIDITLDIGRYWLCTISNDSTIDWSCCNEYFPLWIDSSDIRRAIGHYYASYPYGALPSTFPSGKYSGIFYFVHLRVAEVF